MKIDYSGIKKICDERGYTMIYAARLCGIAYSAFRSVAVLGHNTNTGTIAKLCYGLNVRPSKLVKFDTNHRPLVEYIPPANPKGVVTYKPLFVRMTYNVIHKKTPSSIHELYDSLGSYTGMNEDVTEKVITSALKARGYDYKAEKKNKGLSPSLRQSINNDRPVNMLVIYDICKVLKCSIDEVFYYK